MNCEKCNELLSDYLDGAISDPDRATLSAHLEECLPCFNVQAELNSIVTFCRDHRGDYGPVPNESALWIRIRNTLEADVVATPAKSDRGPARASWWSRVMQRSWELSFPQAAAAVLAIIAIASLVTLLSMRGLNGSDSTASAADSTNPAIAAMGGDPRSGGVRGRDWQQQQIDYLIRVVEQRKEHWNPQVRADFERNLQMLDVTLNESLDRLTKHPHDDVTEEMLNSALDDKMQLLKEFSDL